MKYPEILFEYSFMLDIENIEENRKWICFIVTAGAANGSTGLLLQHKTLTVATSDEVYVCPIFSVRRVAAESDAYRLEFEDNNSLMDYIDQAAAGSLYPIDVDIGDAARVMTLSTCTGWRDQRFIVQAVLPIK